MLKQLSTLTAGLLVSLSIWAAPTVEMTTSLGKITLELNAEKAPKTVETFLENVRRGFYDGTKPAEVDQAIEDGICQGWVADGLVPMLDRQLACDDCGSAAVAIFEDL